jgi:hypothetical protein
VFTVSVILPWLLSFNEKQAPSVTVANKSNLFCSSDQRFEEKIYLYIFFAIAQAVLVETGTAL